MVIIPWSFYAVNEDPSGDMFLICSKAAGAKTLITGDQHLLAFKSNGNTSSLRHTSFSITITR